MGTKPTRSRRSSFLVRAGLKLESGARPTVWTVMVTSLVMALASVIIGGLIGTLLFGA